MILRRLISNSITLMWKRVLNASPTSGCSSNTTTFTACRDYVSYRFTEVTILQSNRERTSENYLQWKRMFHKRQFTDQKCDYNYKYNIDRSPCQRKVLNLKQFLGVPPSDLIHSRNISISARNCTSAIPPHIIQRALLPDNKERVINHLQKMKPNNRLIAGCKVQAAILVPFCVVNAQPSVLFTLRSSNLGKHRGEVSFPGGKKEVEDKSLVETAVRETVEELGIEVTQVDVWAPLPPMPDRIRMFAITPVLGHLGEVAVESLMFNQQEVSEVFSMPLLHAVSNRRYTTFKSGARLPVFVNGPHKVWGITAIILDRTLEVLFPKNYRMIFRA